MPATHRLISRRPRAAEVDPAVLLDLERALRAGLEGEVRFGGGDRALYATDASNYRQVPLGVVVPRTVDDIVRTVAACAARDLPVMPRGGGTSLAGQTCNAAVVIDASKHLRRIVRIDAERRLAEVEPGCVLDVLRDAAEAHHLTFGPDPATHSRNTLGGMIGNDSCGVHSIMAGRTADNIHSLDVLTYDGARFTAGPTSREELQAIVAQGGRRAEIYQALRAYWDRWGAQFERVYPRIPRRISGYENLDQLSWEKGFNVARALVGTEATCVVVLGATVELVPSPPGRALAILGFEDVYKAADAVCPVLEHGPIALEGIDDLLVDYLTRKHLDPGDVEALPEGRGWLIVEFGGSTVEDAAAQARALTARFSGRTLGVKVLTSPGEQEKIWKVREDALAATAHVPGVGETYPGWEDSAVPRAVLGRYLRELKALFARYGYEAAVYGHFGDGLVHCRINFDIRTEAGVKAWLAFLSEAADLVVKFGGSLSGEHGDGQARAALLEKMYGAELLQAHREFRAIWDPRGRMNPGKLIDPFPIDSNLRLGPAYRPPAIKGLFAYPEDGGSFSKAVERCVGVGACRRPDSDGGVMCPSFMATREEKHSTRGRARLLFEMVHGGQIADGWRSDAVEEALDLCLACKGCKKDCPVQVDMASYKADFRARHYRSRLRPRAAYALGQIRRWSEFSQIAPWAANALLRAPGLAQAAKAIGGVSQRRRLPAFADRSFRKQWRQRGRRPSRGDERVILWPDTFNDFFRPGAAMAAAEVLEALGFEVSVPLANLCCGRPLYDWGWLEQARALWRRTLNVLHDEIMAGTTVVGLEPACVSAFRDELPELFPGDPVAARLSRQTRLFSEFLDDCDAAIPRLKGHALVQLHCHQHAVLDAGAEERVLSRSGMQVDVLKSGCCGMAGAFGFEAAKYDVSLAAAERVLLPAVRAASPEVSILADGFSCRTQIEDGSGRRTLHLAEMLRSGLHDLS